MASWVHRTSLANGFFCAGALLRSEAIGFKQFSRLDVGPKRAMAIDVFSDLSLLPKEAVAKLMLTDALEHLGVGPSPGGWPWVLQTSKVTKASSGAFHAICPLCLQGDETPYWRQFWRLATAIRCPIHDQALIERCPDCNTPINLNHLRRESLDRCEFCGTLYQEHAAKPRHRDAVWWVDFPPSSLQPQHLPLQVADPVLWWYGVRALLKVLCQPALAARLSTAEVPPAHLATLRNLAQAPKTEFSQHSLDIRHDLLRLVDWLLLDWPSNFVMSMQRARITAWHFNTMEFSLPFWLQNVCIDKLTAKRYRVSKEEVLAADSVLSKLTPSRSKIALKRALGITEGKALDTLMPIRQQKLTHSTISRVIAMLDNDIESASSSREAQASLLRDACCISVSVWLGQTFLQVAKLSFKSGLELNQSWGVLAAMDDANTSSEARYQIELSRIFFRWGDRYANGVRQRFSRHSHDPSEYFITRFGKPYKGFGLASCFANLLRKNGVEDWNRGARLLHNNGVV